MEIFGPSLVDTLRAAVADLSWLLTRDYAPVSSAKLVGDRYQLLERQRTAVQRCACGDDALTRRTQNRVAPVVMGGAALWIDGFNLLTTLETALGGGFVFVGRDGCCRDMAGIHGHYKRVEETRPALALAGHALAALSPAEVTWLLDRPVSNSGRLAQSIREVAAEHGWPWQVELVPDPDPVLAAACAEVLVATADSAILDAGPRWVNLTSIVIQGHIAEARVLDLSLPPV